MWYKKYINNLLNKFQAKTRSGAEEDDTAYLDPNIGTVGEDDASKTVQQIGERWKTAPYQPRPTSAKDTPFVQKNLPQPIDINVVKNKIAVGIFEKLQQESVDDPNSDLHDILHDIEVEYTNSIKENTPEEDALIEALGMLEEQINKHGKNFREYEIAGAKVIDVPLSTRPEGQVRELTPSEKQKRKDEIFDTFKSIAKIRRTEGVRRRAPGVNVEQAIYDDMLAQPQYDEHTIDGMLLRELYNEGKIAQHKSVERSKITDTQRSALYDLIVTSYLSEEGEPNKQVRESTFDIWFGNKFIDSRTQELRNTPSNIRALRGDVEPMQYISEKLMKPVANKEKILSFFNPQNSSENGGLWGNANFVRKMKDFILQDADEQFGYMASAREDEEIEKFKETSADGAASANFLQNSKRIDFFWHELENIIKGEAPASEAQMYDIDYKILKSKFRDWISTLISKESWRQIQENRPATGAQATVSEEGQPQDAYERATEKNLSTNRGTYSKITSLSLNSCREIPEITRDENLQYFDVALKCLNHDWSLLNNYIEKVVVKIREEANNPISVADKNYFENLLQKAYIWDSMRQITDRAVKSLSNAAQSVTEKTVLNISGIDLQNLINRRWKDIFKNRFFEAQNFSLQDQVAVANDEFAFDFTGDEDSAASQSAGALDQSSAASISASNQSIKDICQKYVNAGYAKDLAEAHASLFGANLSKFQYPQIVSEGTGAFARQKRIEPTGAAAITNRNALLEFRRRAGTNLKSLEKFILDPEIMNAPELEGVGSQIALTFMSLIGYSANHGRFGLAFSQKNIAGFQEKISILSDMLTRGGFEKIKKIDFMSGFKSEEADLRAKYKSQGMSDEQIEKQIILDRGRFLSENLDRLTPEKLNEIFSVIKIILPAVYGGTTAAKQVLESGASFLDDEIVNDCISSLDPSVQQQIKSILENGKLTPKSAAKLKKIKGLEGQDKPWDQLAATFLAKAQSGFYIEKAQQYEAMISAVNRIIKERANNNTYLRNNNFVNKDQFLANLGLFDSADYKAQLERLGKSKVRGMCRYLSINLAALFDERLLDKYMFEDLSSDTTRTVSMHDLIRQILNSQKAPALAKVESDKYLDWDTVDLFAKMLDSLPSRKYASNYFNISKYAGIKAVDVDNYRYATRHGRKQNNRKY